MSTNLSAITNAKLNLTNVEVIANEMLTKLKELKWDTTSVYKPTGLVKQEGDWSLYYSEDDDPHFNIEFCGPFDIRANLFSNITLLDTIYRYWLIYENYNLDWFAKFRKHIFDIVTICGGTEIIYLADHSARRLCHYLEAKALENIHYETIKSEMIEEFGNPVTDYKLLDLEGLSYDSINEFFLDDFADLRLETNTK
jgi:hypothetical protein